MGIVRLQEQLRDFDEWPCRAMGADAMVRVDAEDLRAVLAALATAERERDEARGKLATLAEHVATTLDNSEVMQHLYRLAGLLGPVFTQIADGTAPNFVTTTVELLRQGVMCRWAFTAQREDGKTPADRIAELTADLTAARAERIGMWRCSCCGEGVEPGEPMPTSWRRTGDAWEHRCESLAPQAGYHPARFFPWTAETVAAMRADHAEALAAARAEREGYALRIELGEHRMA